MLVRIRKALSCHEDSSENAVLGVNEVNVAGCNGHFSKLVRNVNNLAVHVLNVLNAVDKRKTLAVNHIAVVSAGLNFKVVIERGDLQNRLIALTCGYRTVKLARLARAADYQSLAVLHQLAFGNNRPSVEIFNI